MPEKLNAEDILNIFKEEHRLFSRLDYMADPSAVLTFSSYVFEWRDALDLLPWRQLYPVLNRGFNISASANDWKPVLTGESTLLDVCSFIAIRSRIASIKPQKLLGRSCLSSAVFLSMKSYLKDNNVDVSDLRPSSSITPYLEKHCAHILSKAILLAKGKRVFEELNLKKKRRKGSFLNYINIFDGERYLFENRYTFESGDIQTFRDLTLKIIEVAY